MSHWNELQAERPIAPSIVATCLGEMPELAEQGVDEEAIRGVNGTIYLGELHQPCGCRGMTFEKPVVWCVQVVKRRSVYSHYYKFSANHFTVKTSSAIKSFFLAATLHPEIVRLGQQELDEVLGGERLPDFSDMPRLPYISAIVKEVLRWRPPAPLGASFCEAMLCAYRARSASGSPRRLTEDDVYKGRFIPAGATIMDNIWYAVRFH